MSKSFNSRFSDMTTAHAHALLTWPPCPLALPPRVRLGPHAEVVDTAEFLACQLSRLQEDDIPPILRKLAQEALHTFLTQVTG